MESLEDQAHVLPKQKEVQEPHQGTRGCGILRIEVADTSSLLKPDGTKTSIHHLDGHLPLGTVWLKNKAYLL